MQMKHLRRILLGAATVCSLVLFVATAVLWVRGYSVSDNFDHVWYGFDADGTYFRGRVITTGRGAIGLLTQEISVRTHSPEFLESLKQQIGEPRFHTTAQPTYPDSRWAPWWVHGWGGFRYGRNDHSGSAMQTSNRRFIFVMPLWAALLTSAILPALWCGRKMKSHRRRGYCPSCGYDLRASPERCPECGRICRAAPLSEQSPTPR
jgi:hypothetical protein